MWPEKRAENFSAEKQIFVLFSFLDEQGMGKRNSKIKKMKRDEENKL